MSDINGSFTVDGVPQPNTSVVLTIVSGPASFGGSSVATVTTDSNGDYSALGLTAGPGGGVVTIVASAGPNTASLPAGVNVSNVSAWGSDHNGNLGNGTTTTGEQSLPVVTELPQSIVAVSSSRNSNSVVAVSAGGAVYTWGTGGQGQLGNGANSNSDVPVAVPALTSGITGLVSAGDDSTYAVGNDGTVWAWGNGYHGSLGQGSSEAGSNVPIAVQGLPASLPVDIASGSSTVYVALSDGTVWSWGSNVGSALGSGSNSPLWTGVPVQVVGLTGATKVAAGDDTGYAIDGAGVVWSWGNDYGGALGNGGSNQNSNIPTEVVGLPAGVKAVDIAGGQNTGYALLEDGTVWSWGSNYEYALGDGTTVGERSSAVQVVNLTDVIAIGAGDYTAYALKSDGTAWAWGGDYEGALGNGGSNVNTNVPTQVAGILADAPGRGISNQAGNNSAYVILP